MICSKCGKDKPTEDFYENVRLPAGYMRRCKECLKQINKLRYRPKRKEPALRTKHWNYSSLLCYKRGCTCKGCFYEQYFLEDEQGCQMKYAVREIIRVNGKPELTEELDMIIED